VARILVIGLALLAGACGSPYGSEHELLSNFFRAARVRDRVITATLGSASFEPQTAGSVEDFTIIDVVHEGDSETVTVDAPVRTPAGTTVAKRLVIVLDPATRETGQTSGSRWMITSIRQQDVPPGR
jgi:hypothetical protein